MNEADALVDRLQVMTETALSGVNTSMPGVVVSYDAARRRAVVRPSLPKRLADGRSLPAPEIVEVPVLWPTAGGATITMPIQPGDGVLLHFSQRSLEGWLGGDNDAPDDPRMFDLSDAVATPGLSASGAPADPVNMVISFGAVSLALTPDGKLLIAAPGGVEIASPLVQADGEIKAGLIGLTTHKHEGVEPGGGISAGPVP